MLTLAIMDAMQLCAAAVNLAYFRKTHDHIDHDAMLKAKEIEKYLDDERRARKLSKEAEEAKEIGAQQLRGQFRGMVNELQGEAPTKAGGLDADLELLEKCREAIRRQAAQENEGPRPKPSGAFELLGDAEVFDMVAAELKKARARYPFWPADIVAAAAIASEEGGEVIKSVNNYYWSQGEEMPGDIRAEAVQAIAMWVRFLTETPAVDSNQLQWNRQVQGRVDTLLAVFADEDLRAQAEFRERQARDDERERVRQELILIRAQVDRSIDWLGM